MENLQKEIGWLLQEKYGGKMTAGAKKDIVRLKKGEPLDYVIGFIIFLGCKILVDGSVLIPRPETEFWAEEAIGCINNSTSPTGSAGQNLQILDMFAGSGCMGIAVLKHIKNSHVVFADSEKPTIGQIQKNGKVNGIAKNRYEVVQSDIFNNVTGKFDYVFANPPYIPVVKKKDLQKSVLDYEPHVALFGGNDGLIYVRKFLADAKDFLNPGGKIYMEFDSFQKPKIETVLKKTGYKAWEFHKDQYGKWRWVAIGI